MMISNYIPSRLNGWRAGWLVLALAGCSTWLPSAGPTMKQMDASIQQGQSGKGALSESDVELVNVDAAVLRELGDERIEAEKTIPATWRSNRPNLVMGNGDIVQVSIFEAPPAVLLGSSASISAATDFSIGSGSGILNLPDQMVSDSGMVTVPFVGQVRAAGRTTAAVEQLIRTRLSKIANQPQVVVRVTQNQANGVIVVADGRSIRLPLTAKGERLMDVVPLAGDAKRVKETSVRLTRNGVSRSLSLNMLSQTPADNVYLQNGDVVTVLQNPYTVTVLGATNTNTVVSFGDDGLSVSEALGRVYGLNDYRADPSGLYVFRQNSGIADAYGMEKPAVYKLDVRDARNIMLSQRFRLRDKDMVYVSNASSIQLQKILSLFNAGLAPVSSTVGTVNAVN